MDQQAGRLMKKLKARSAPKLTNDFPANTCISVNSIIAHGIPDHHILRSGDQVIVDVATELNGYFGDVAYTFIVGQKHHRLDRFCRIARNTTFLAIQNSLSGTKLSVIGKIMEDYVRKQGYTILKNLCSHGVGKTLHDYPAAIFNYYDPSAEEILEPGMVIAWEPFISSGASRAIMAGKDDWSLTTHNQSRVAQYEHTVLITDSSPEILTRL